ncbi:MAG: peptidylprolyl isomerase [Oscillospiraceae bacterium]|nr:peptidylprolyl isomerase [Oscillospiraceae bacterium]
MLKKAFSLLTATIVLGTALCACAPKKEQKITVNDKEYSASQTVLEIGENDVSLEFFRYCYLAVKSGMVNENSAIDFSKEENAKRLKDEVIKETKRMYAVMELAKKHGYTLTDEDAAEIENTMKETFESAGSAADYKALLEENNLTNGVYKKALEINALSAKMAETLCGTDKKTNKIVFTIEQAVKNYSDSHSRFMNMYFPAEYLNESGQALPSDEYEKNKAEAKKKADAALSEIKNGASFADTMKKYMGEATYEADLQSYYEEEAISESLGYDLSQLEVGEISEVVFAQSCYYIILRLENDVEYLTSIADDVATVYAEQVYEEKLDEIAAGYDVKETELYKEIVFDSFGK